MYTLAEIRELIKLIDETSVTEVTIQNEGEKLCIRKIEKTITIAPTASGIHVPSVTQNAMTAVHNTQEQPTSNLAVPLSEAAVATNVQPVTSPMVGTFYRTSAPGSAAYVEIGTRVTEKSIVCILEAMKVMNEIEADVTGEIVEILAENGQLVEYGQPLFLVKVD